MKTGAIAVITKDGHDIDHEQFPTSRQKSGFKLHSTLETDWTQSLLNGRHIIRGRAVAEQLEKVKSPTIETDGGVQRNDIEQEKTAVVSEFAYVPGEFVLTESTSDDFVGHLIEHATDAHVRRGKIDLSQFADAHSEANFWMGWSRSSHGPIDNIFASGDIDDDPDVAQLVKENKSSQLGLRNVEFEGRLMKLVLSESGWVEVHRPKDMGTVEFTRFVDQEVMPHTFVEQEVG